MSAELTMARLAARCQTVRRNELTSSSTRASRGSSLSQEDLETALYLPLFGLAENKDLNFSMGIIDVLCNQLLLLLLSQIFK